MAENQRAMEQRGTIGFELTEYGRSVKGLPLEYLPPSSGECDLFIFAAIHGQEPDTTMLLSKALRLCEQVHERVAVAMVTNPDGLMAGTRCNANGVDLNRNFPSENWGTEPYLDYWERHLGKTVPLSTGSSAGSEPETQALVSLIEKLSPKQVITLHGPLDCVDDPEMSELGSWLSKRSGMELVPNVGYPTPGSFGSWAGEKGIHVVTYELPNESSWNCFEVHLPIFHELMTYGTEAWTR